MKFTDQTLTCSDCHQDFIFSAGEQSFFFDKKFKHTPKRCKPCRAKLGAKPQPVVVTEIVCSGCGTQSSVPFRPTQGRPVFCHSCFTSRKAQVAVPA